MNTFKQVRIEDIISNQRRNFKLHPMDKGHVRSLIESYEKAGDFGVIPVRLMEDGDYEQAAGHHRIEAMRKMGFTHADCKVIEADDNEMVRIMVNENNTQQGNVNPAKLDSINAIMGQVAYALLLSDTPKHYCEAIGINFSNRIEKFPCIKTAKTKIANGEAVPYLWLKAFDGDVCPATRMLSESFATN